MTKLQELKYILAHGSSNKFVMIDAVSQEVESGTAAAAEYVRQVCEKFKSDGALFVERFDDEYLAMNMYNTDGTQAEMCGNGMRIVARLADERYINEERFTLFSGGRAYPIVRSEVNEVRVESGEMVSIPNYGVEIAIRTSSDEFTPSQDQFIDRAIEELHPTLRFTYLNLGNPHIIAKVDEIDLDLLSKLGERVKELPHIFTRGVNVSLMMPIGEGEIFVATYERGVGLTASCGTAMTASSTTAALLGICKWGEAITVRNRGGFVKCICNRDESGELRTQLIGNATYIESGVISSTLEIVKQQSFDNEVEAWDKFTKQQQ
ncbi:MAG: diaminopimelate epimerase [Rikenellaceae bacterium]